MRTTHEIIFRDSRKLDCLESESIGLVVTSPPYPFIEMWDGLFASLNPRVAALRVAGDSRGAFELMHRDLDEVWGEVYRVLEPGAIACINVGDATRTEAGLFQLFSNHSRILDCCLRLGFIALPEIIWRKQTNAPNKFMGSGMMPPGAYVTLEHEFILILRKGRKRGFAGEADALNRMRSAFFWEERNSWFSDVWDFKGARQGMNGEAGRTRNGSFPFELAYRLVNMFSVKGDRVLDPFVGAGTTIAAAMASGRNSIGVEIEQAFGKVIEPWLRTAAPFLNSVIRDRLQRHVSFVRERGRTAFKHESRFYGFPVMTKQEREILLNYVRSVKRTGEGRFEVEYFEEALLELNGLPLAG